MSNNNENDTANEGTLYLPDFYDEYQDFQRHPPNKETAALVAKKDWLTKDLLEELGPHCFQRTPENPNPTPEALENACKAFFFKDRVFASSAQYSFCTWPPDNACIY